jgi:hypothetical protein
MYFGYGCGIVSRNLTNTKPIRYIKTVMRYGGRNADRYDNYVAFTAKRASDATCGHKVAVGDRIGWHPTLKKVYCATCWAKWTSENLAEASYEQYGTDCAFDC